MVRGAVVIRTTKSGQERTVQLPTRVTSRFGAGPKWFPDNHSMLVEVGDADGPGFGLYRLSLDTANTELVARLPERQRAVVIMRYWQDAQERDIAASLGITPRAVRAMLKRAYAKLRVAYEQSESQ